MSLSKQETQFLTTFSASNRNIFSYEQAVEYFQSATAASNTLGRLVRKGWLHRLERGSYMIIPLEAGPDRNWAENAYVLSSALIHPGALAYWSALRFWNMTEQIPHQQFIQTTRRKKPITIQGTRFQFITVIEKHFFGIVTRSIENKPIHITDREKTMIDVASRPDLGGGMTNLAAILSEFHSEIDWDRFTLQLKQWGGGAAAKRIGYLVEALSLPIPSKSERLAAWQSMLSTGISLLEPGVENQGPIVTRWRLRINIDL